MVFVVVNGSVVRLDLHGDDVSLLLGDLVVLVGVLADHPVQAAVGHLGVAGAREVHREHLQHTTCGVSSGYLLFTANVRNT